MGPFILDRLDRQAQSLVQQLATECQNGDWGSTTVAIYDTAWVSMVSKVGGGQQTWLFPECFQFLLDNQLPSGGWQSYSTRDDGLLNTLAALLAMRKHFNESNTRPHPNLSDLNARMLKAMQYLQVSLQHWVVDESLHIDSEILVEALLSMPESENIHFVFPGRQELEKLNARKMAKFDPEVLYRSPTTFLRSLEAFIDRIDCDRLGYHKACGSMMASPASTAAYMIGSSIWDSEAELYLRKVLREGSGKGTGGVPGVFPIPIFEISWILSTLFQSGFSSEALGKENINTIVVYLQYHLHHQHGLLGFAPSVLADADDTAKALLTLTLSCKAAKPDQMIAHFKTEKGHFRTYPGETHASFSANCNVLVALIHMPNVEDYCSCISSIITFLSDSWWSGVSTDKWNNSLQYSMMLLAEALTELLVVWDKGLLNALPEAIIRGRIPVILIQVLNRTLLAPRASGQWGSEGCPEITAYGILTLKALLPLPWPTSIQEAAISGIRAGQQLLDQSQNEWTKPTYIWVGKVTYGSPRLSEAYCLAAMKMSTTSYAWSDRLKSLVNIPEKLLSQIVQFFSTLQGLQSEPRWVLVASALEGHTFLWSVKSARSQVLPKQGEAQNESLAHNPFTWTLTNNHHRLFLSANVLLNTAVVTSYNFRMDEYMKSTVVRLSNDDLKSIKSLIYDLCRAERPDRCGTEAKHSETVEKAIHGTNHLPTNEAGVDELGMKGMEPQSNATDRVPTNAHEGCSVSALTRVRAVLSHYTRAMLNHPHVRGASTSDHSDLRNALRTFLLSHIAQIAENSNFATQSSCNSSTTSVSFSPRQSFYSWVHTSGTESVSCAVSFAFLTCLLGAASATAHERWQEPADDCFDSARQKYLAHEVCTHLAVMSRLCKDYGSVERDRKEADINSINFPEFHRYARGTITHAGTAEHERKLKEELLELVKIEQQSADKASETLRNLAGTFEAGGRRRGKDKANAVTSFIEVTKLYAYLYVARDKSNRIVATSK